MIWTFDLFGLCRPFILFLCWFYSKVVVVLLCYYIGVCYLVLHCTQYIVYMHVIAKKL
jgi:hypothetical protein